MTLYPRVVEATLMAEEDTLEVTRLLHNHQRLNRGLDKAAKEAVNAHAQLIVRDLKRGVLPPHQIASLHLLSYFKDTQKYDSGVEFWNWLVRQDASHADARTYGAAIELLAFSGEPLEDLEVLYAQAMKLFPGDFSEYHLSPGAIVPDRRQPTIISGVRMSLLQGILTARLLHGDWRNAYLALDTALRLYPTQLPPRIYELFLYERPLSEGYKVFMVACRAGNVPKGTLLTLVLDGLSGLQSPKLDASINVTLAIAMLDAFRAFVGTAGRVEVIHLNALIRGLLGGLYNAMEHDGLDLATVSGIEQLKEAFQELGIATTTATFNTMISMGGKLKRPDVVVTASKQLVEYGLQPNAVTYRTLLNTGGDLDDLPLIESSWTRLEEASNSSATVSLDLRDWQALARACRKSGHNTYLEDQVAKYGVSTSPSIQAVIRREMGRPSNAAIPKSPAATFTPANVPIFAETISALLAQLQTPALHNFHTSPLPMGPLSSSPSDESTRVLYDALTTDPYSPAPPSSTDRKEPRSPTGFPLADLRFENWRSVNELLALAERNTRAMDDIVDEALSRGEAVGRRGKGARGDSRPAAEIWGEEGNPQETEGWEEKALRLRGLARPTGPQV
ncbi:MAG: hypothetical protein M1832_001516 [Thelocarpon impressellum]|nr:MAG: hypothetical protein M1832_001516 [Thelocarpon impressellum]